DVDHRVAALRRVRLDVVDDDLVGPLRDARADTVLVVGEVDRDVAVRHGAVLLDQSSVVLALAGAAAFFFAGTPPIPSTRLRLVRFAGFFRPRMGGTFPRRLCGRRALVR